MRSGGNKCKRIMYAERKRSKFKKVREEEQNEGV